MDAVATLWNEAGLPGDALPWLALEGEDPVLPSSFAIGRAAASVIGAAGLAAALLWRERTGRLQRVGVAVRDAALEFRSERLLRVDGQPAPELWDRIAGLYPTRDGYVRIHTNFPHHRDGFLALLGCAYAREAVAAALARWEAVEFEDAAAERGLPVAAHRTASEWARHAQAGAVAALPTVEVVALGEAPAEPLPAGGDRPLAGVRVLDLTRVIAGPVCGRTLAAHGADVLAITAPYLPFMLPTVMDCNRGKRTAFLDLRRPEDRAQLDALVREADVFVQGYRPGALAHLGYGPERLAELRPGLVCVSLSAWGRAGPWAGRRGFDSLVQTASGLNADEAAAAGAAEPRPLPAQALDHGAGHLMAFGAMAALHRRATRGGTWHVQVSLARTALWLRELGRVPGGTDASAPDSGDILEASASGFGRLLAVRHAARLAETPARYGRPSMPLGTDAPAWPKRARAPDDR
jgi:crotonobetainyl-CoA:carnitine CoA-transferase CaiB-like acyl-CoA transferase